LPKSASLTPHPADELVAKLESEIQVERDISQPTTTQPGPSIQDFLDNSGFQLHDTPGVEEVLLTRTVGDETIEVRFTIADLASPDVEGAGRSEDLDEFDDEDFDAVQGGATNAKGAINQNRGGADNVKIAPEDSVAPADRAEAEGDEELEPGQGPAFPARVTVKITKEGQKGALTVECVAQDGDIIIENVYYFSDGELADPKTAEGDWKRRNAYAGPPFGNLDEGLQIEFEKYLEERGINTYMAVFIPDYIDFKEQKEYVRWLESKSNIYRLVRLRC